MGAAHVAKDNRLPSRSVAVSVSRPSRPEVTGMALALEDCPGGEDLDVLTGSPSSMRLLKNVQRQDFPLQLHRHTARQLLLDATKPINKRAESGGLGARRALHKGSCAQRRAAE